MTDSPYERRSSLSSLGAFLITGLVDPSSPAEVGGLIPGDLIFKFGEIDRHSFLSVRETIGPYCQAHLNSTIELQVQRKGATEGEKIILKVTPQLWAGYGVLGVHFYNLNEKEGAFMKVKDVLPGSPADIAGLQNKDHIVEFGTVTAETYVDLEKNNWTNFSCSS